MGMFGELLIEVKQGTEPFGFFKCYHCVQPNEKK